jgi:DNA-binding MarR family transcriptional regulator
VEAGLLQREVDPDDRRAALLLPTQAGTARIARWRQARSALVGEALGRLTRHDVATLGAALPALRNLLDELAEERTP